MPGSRQRPCWGRMPRLGYDLEEKAGGEELPRGGAFPGERLDWGSFHPCSEGPGRRLPLSQNTLRLGTGKPCGCSNRFEACQDQQETIKSLRSPGSAADAMIFLTT